MTDPPRPKFIRGAALVAALAGLWWIARISGLSSAMTVDGLRETAEGAGVTGILLFLAAFSVGVLVQIPGMVFISAAALMWGAVAGTIVALAGAVTAACVSFMVIRTVGGSPLSEASRPLLKKMLARLERNPVCTVALLRSVFWVAPPLNVALSLSGVSFRGYAAGSALGLVLPVAAACTLVNLAVG